MTTSRYITKHINLGLNTETPCTNQKRRVPT